MTRFAYEALDARGKVVQGMVDAPNVECAIENLRTSRFTVTHVKAQLDVSHSVSQFTEQFIPVRAYPLVIFTRQLATILNSGIPLLKGLECLIGQGLDSRLTRIIMSVSRDVRQGMSMSTAMARHPQAFGPVYLSMIRAGETSGSLPDILNRLALLTERDYALRRRVQAAMTYPIFVFACALIATEIIVSYVFPTFVNLLESIGTRLPLPTRILIFVTHASRDPAVIVSVILGVFLFGLLFRQFVRHRSGRLAFDRFVLAVPVLGTLQLKVCVARFCRTLGSLLGAGITMIQAIEIVGIVSGNAALEAATDDLVQGLRLGLRLSQPVHDNPLFPSIMYHLIAIGEESGSLPTILEKLAYFYDTEVEALLATLSSLLEPLMVAGMGMVVGFVVIAVFLPIYSILGSLH